MDFLGLSAALLLTLLPDKFSNNPPDLNPQLSVCRCKTKRSFAFRRWIYTQEKHIFSFFLYLAFHNCLDGEYQITYSHFWDCEMIGFAQQRLQSLWCLQTKKQNQFLSGVHVSLASPFFTFGLVWRWRGCRWETVRYRATKSLTSTTEHIAASETRKAPAFVAKNCFLFFFFFLNLMPALLPL